MRSRKPTVTTKCPANAYSAPNERIVEFSDSHGNGGLISFTELEDGTLGVSVYRTNGVTIGRNRQGRCVMTPLPKGSFAVAHIQKSGYSLLAGHYGYDRFFVVCVLSATHEGEVKTFTDTFEHEAPKRVDRHVTIYSMPAQFDNCGAAMLAKQPLDFTGYATKADLKAAFEALEIAP